MTEKKATSYIAGVREHLAAEHPEEFERCTKQPFVSQHYIKQVVDLLLLDKNPYTLFTKFIDDTKPWQICVHGLPYMTVGDMYVTQSRYGEHIYVHDIGKDLTELFLTTKKWQAYMLWSAYNFNQQAPTIIQTIITRVEEELKKYDTDCEELKELRNELKIAWENIKIANRLKIQHSIDFTSYTKLFNEMRRYEGDTIFNNLYVK